MIVNIGCIVEGQGDVRALPVLIRRVIESHDLTVAVKTEAILVAKSKLLRPGGLENAAELAARRSGPNGGILVVIDSGNDCPAAEAPKLGNRLRHARSDRPSAVVLAKMEFEAWFLAAAESLRGKRGLATDLAPPTDPEAIQGAKEWLDRHKSPGDKYTEVLDQPALSAVFDLDMATARSRSFRKLRIEVIRLCEEVRKLAT